MLYWYRQYGRGGVAEFFHEHGVSLQEERPRKIRKLIHDLEKCLIHSPQGYFICAFHNTSFIFDGPDEMGTLHFYLTDAYRVIRSNQTGRRCK